jgi:eukaryotic-like serine/threonine-protein kinase
VAGIAVLLVVLFMLKPWDKSDDDNELAGGDTGTSPAAEQAQENTEAAEETSDDSEGDAEEDNSENNNNDNEEDNTDEQTTEEEPELVELGDYVGYNVMDAVDELENEGFTVTYSVPTQLVGQYEECEVTSQDPPAGSEVSYDTEIHLEHAPGADCSDSTE